MSAKRVSLKQRREQDRRGMEALLESGGCPPATQVSPGVRKVTLYLRPEQILKLEEIQLEVRRRTGRRPDKSELAQEAMDLLIQKYERQG